MPGAIALLFSSAVSAFSDASVKCFSIRLKSESTCFRTSFPLYSFVTFLSDDFEYVPLLATSEGAVVVRRRSTPSK